MIVSSLTGPPTEFLRTKLPLTHWGRVTHICVGKLTINGSDNGLSPGRRQAIIWTNAGILLIRPLGTKFSEILIGIQTFSFTKIYLKMSSAKWRLFSLGLNVLISSGTHFTNRLGVYDWHLVTIHAHVARFIVICIKLGPGEMKICMRKQRIFLYFLFTYFSFVGILSPQIVHEMVTEWQGENACYNSQL